MPLDAHAWEFACPDWEEKLRAGLVPMPDLPIDEVEADRALTVLDEMKLVDVPGQPTFGEAGGPWFRTIARTVVGSLDHETGERRIGEVFCLVPKKNAKSTGAGLLGVLLLWENVRQHAEAYVVGPTQEVADVAFSAAAGAIEESPKLSKRFDVLRHKSEIYDRWMKTTLRIVSFDPKTLTGKIPIFVILDELHVMATMSKADAVLRQLRGGMIARPESILIIITTQSDGSPAGVFKTELDYARSVRDGREQGSRMLPILYELPERVQKSERKLWRDPKYWPQVLPNLGYSITLERLISEHRGARARGAAAEIAWASQHLNVEVGIGLHAERWRAVDYWPKAATGPSTLEALLEAVEVAAIGIDGGGLDDLFALGVVGREKKTRRWLAWAHAWVHPDALEQRKEIAPRLQGFIDAGHLALCETPTQDIEEAAAMAVRIRETGLLPERYSIGLDPYGVTALVDEMVLAGFDREVDLVNIPQGTRLTGVINGTERKLKDGTLVHGDQPLLTWAIGNCRTEQRGSAITITKATAGKAKIDPAVAVLNAISIIERDPTAAGSKRSPWDDEDFRLAS